jgi:hypothetical protein
VYSATVKYIPVVLWGDALPFFQARVAAAMLMSVEDLDDPTYHRPADDAVSIQP